MKILLVSSGSGSRGGGEIFLNYLGGALAARGHSVISWMPAHARMNELASQCAEFSQVVRAEFRNTYDYRSRSLATLLNSRSSNSIARQWAELKPDIIHVNKQNLEDGLDLLRAARVSGRPSVCTIHLTQTARYLRARAALLRDMVSWWELRKFEGDFVAVQDIRRDELSSFLGSEATDEDGFQRRSASRCETETRAEKRNARRAQHCRRSTPCRGAGPVGSAKETIRISGDGEEAARTVSARQICLGWRRRVIGGMAVRDRAPWLVRRCLVDRLEVGCETLSCGCGPVASYGRISKAFRLP